MTLSEYVHNTHAAKQSNARTVLRAIENRSRLSRTDAALLCNLNPASITALCSDLMENDLIRECGRAQSGSGRKPVYLELNPSAGYSICLCPEGDGFLLSFHNLHHEIIRTSAISYPENRNQIEACCHAVFALIAKETAPGILCFCIVDHTTEGIVKECIEAISAKASLLSCPVYTINAPTLACLAQAHANFPDGEGTVVSLYIEKNTVSVGILAGSMLLFPSQYSGRLGQHAIESTNRIVNTEDSYTLQSIAYRALQCSVTCDIPPFNPAELHMSNAYSYIAESARMQNWHAKEIIQEYSAAISTLIYSVSCMYNPDILLLGGEILSIFDLLAEPIGIHLSALFDKVTNRPSIITGQPGTLAFRYGASRLSVNSILSETPLTRRNDTPWE